MSDRPQMMAEDLRRALADCPFHQLFDLKLRTFDATAGTLELQLGFTPVIERVRGSGQYHGGAIALLIDIAGDFALFAVLGYGVPTINFRVDYLRPATRSDLIACAVVRRAGRTVGVVDVEVRDDADHLVAVGRGCYGTHAG